MCKRRTADAGNRESRSLIPPLYSNLLISTASFWSPCEESQRVRDVRSGGQSDACKDQICVLEPVSWSGWNRNLSAKRSFVDDAKVQTQLDVGPIYICYPANPIDYKFRRAEDLSRPAWAIWHVHSRFSKPPPREPAEGPRPGLTARQACDGTRR
ncbi:hypothetical protein VTN02DRAFT_5204 [Thermoascus thermophilus]